MSKVAVIAKLTAAPGKRDEVVAALSGVADAVNDEPGTEVYALHFDAGDQDVVWFFELYRDNDALSAHAGSAAMKAAGPELGQLLGGPAELHLLQPVRAKGLAID